MRVGGETLTLRLSKLNNRFDCLTSQILVVVSKTSNHFQTVTQSAMKSIARHLVLKKVNRSEHTEDTKI